MRERTQITKFTKKALIEATHEVQKSKPNFEHKLAHNIKSDNTSLCAYVRRIVYVSRMSEIRLDHWRTMLGIK